ncbi:hypothetical protein KKF34_15785 [Myxococcota bacterium]|nr:hypothetical protein [Myxococcota bacterium]MBU1380193.1 hypothetical protein [Myxococcota bacterium]MBU1498337.1 hypothetical protein [Myxococcota bacterium]
MNNFTNLFFELGPEFSEKFVTVLIDNNIIIPGIKLKCPVCNRYSEQYFYENFIDTKPYEIIFSVYPEKKSKLWPDFVEINSNISSFILGLFSERLMQLLFGNNFTLFKGFYQANINYGNDKSLNPSLLKQQIPNYYWVDCRVINEVITENINYASISNMICYNCNTYNLKKMPILFNHKLKGGYKIFSYNTELNYIRLDFRLFIKKHLIKDIFSENFIGIRICTYDGQPFSNELEWSTYRTSDKDKIENILKWCENVDGE